MYRGVRALLLKEEMWRKGPGRTYFVSIQGLPGLQVLLSKRVPGLRDGTSSTDLVPEDDQGSSK